jgi:hypothetical protein
VSSDRVEVGADGACAARTATNLLGELPCRITQVAARRMVWREQRNVAWQIRMATPKALIQALRPRYRSAAFNVRIKIHAEFVALTCRHGFASAARRQVAARG